MSALILAWLQSRGEPAIAVDSVDAFGWSMDDTDACGCERFAVELRWTDTDGIKRYDRIEGDDMAALWKWVTDG